MKIKASISAAVLAIGLISCADAEFSGSNASKKRSGSNQAPANPNNTDPSNPSTNITPGGGSNNPGINNGNGGGLSIEWGSLAESWHIGNNEFSDTGCKARVAVNLLDSWSEANFYFKVLENNTTVNINVLHCGVDRAFAQGGSNSDKDTATLVDFNNQVVNGMTMNLNLSDNFFFLSSQAFPNSVTLNAGTYKIKVRSGERSDGELDDFVVRAKVTANKPIERDPEPKRN